MLLLNPRQARIGHDILRIGLAFEIVKGLDRKENAVYPHQDGIE